LIHVVVEMGGLAAAVEAVAEGLDPGMDPLQHDNHVEEIDAEVRADSARDTASSVALVWDWVDVVVVVAVAEGLDHGLGLAGHKDSAAEVAD
jgi:hypothetical protein